MDTLNKNELTFIYHRGDAILFSCLRVFYLSNTNKQIYLTPETLTATTTSSESGPESNGNNEVLHTCQSSITGASPSDAV